MRTYLIDDDALGVYLTEQLLRAEGFSTDISAFQCPKMALDVLIKATTTMDDTVVFLDLNMPLMNGWQFLDALAPYKDKLLGHCHIYILTSSLALADLEKSRQYDLVAGLIHKPIDSEEIHAIQDQLANKTGAE
ncbi:Response regulator receiver domain-containing protein [Hymenobacter daecheongensis DSM 21074]|uniref:Response regulator receiver domain-containing protein n=1 Tax=Hymenobacter daecheongensis DSM 21074 TaxID=1121955 RepID=A0A1M6ETL8_9BACT|nr:response regulator [Hymenobacter daecheongensis]SHI88844.1 Response regulator receiver domain-containing protein [Hymenobacter daecheongensis DSM 21074]